MLEILIGIIGLFVSLFLEHFLFALFGFSLFILIFLNMWGRVSSRFFFPFLLFLGISLDITMHQPIGLHILVLGVALLIYILFETFLPDDNSVSKYISMLFVFLLFYFLNAVLLSLLQDGIIPIFTSGILIKIFANSLISVLVSMLVGKVFSTVRDSKNYQSIRLR
ncbi:MAG: hypothetical protein RBT33_01950 [Candidatus Dojkabacteria bacterium]|jgi:hypothetical protein|nr:hypothetical protein [Candidatus Dojkabacteria bacterium]